MWQIKMANLPKEEKRAKEELFGKKHQRLLTSTNPASQPATSVCGQQKIRLRVEKRLLYHVEALCIEPMEWIEKEYHYVSARTKGLTRG